MTDQTLAVEFRMALRPLHSRLNKERTFSLGKSGILHTLHVKGPATASELAVSERISPQAVANALRELEEMTFVARVRDEVDRRKLMVAITEPGQAALESERNAGTGWLADALMERLDESERAVLASAVPVLRKLMAEPAGE